MKQLRTASNKNMTIIVPQQNTKKGAVNMDKTLDEKAREARNKYYREYRRKNKEKVKEYERNYWLRQAEKQEVN